MHIYPLIIMKAEAALNTAANSLAITIWAQKYSILFGITQYTHSAWLCRRSAPAGSVWGRKTCVCVRYYYKPATSKALPLPSLQPAKSLTMFDCQISTPDSLFAPPPQLELNQTLPARSWNCEGSFTCWTRQALIKSA